MDFLLLLKVVIAIAVIGTVSMIIQMLDSLVFKPERLRSKLRKQGIRGPPPSFLLGNIREMKSTQSNKVSKAPPQEHEGQQVITHNCSLALFPHFDKWRKEYGQTFVFSLGNIPLLHISHPDLVKEITVCTSWDLGKPSYEHQDWGPLFGQGILTSNRALWAHQRKILAPELYLDKVNGMISLMVESSMVLVKSWANKIEPEGGLAGVKIDGYMRSFSGDVISRACFGSCYSKGEEIFRKLRALQESVPKKLFSGIPTLRFLPTKSNREIWRLEKQVRELILEVVRERKEAGTSQKDLLQMILEAASHSDHLGREAIDRFVVDNCKNIYMAGYETTAVSLTWTLMLLASEPEWQERVRSEAVEICGAKSPDADAIRKMKILPMVINESLRLYPPATIIPREALEDMKLGYINVPKGVNVWTPTVTLHQDPEIWGPDAHKFNPERFANGVGGACKFPHVDIPFGAGPRTCLGQNFAMAELKILLAILFSNFSFTLSPNYEHSPTRRLLVEPEHGVDLLIRRL